MDETWLLTNAQWIKGLGGGRTLVAYQDGKLLVDSATVARFFKIPSRVLQALAATKHLQSVSCSNNEVLYDFRAIEILKQAHGKDWDKFIRNVLEKERKQFSKRLGDYVKLCKKFQSKQEKMQNRVRK